MGVSGLIKLDQPGWLLVEGHERIIKVFKRRMKVLLTLTLTLTLTVTLNRTVTLSLTVTHPT